MEHILKPRSIAVVGASEEDTYGGRFLRNLLRYGYKGTVYPVNPKYKKIGELTCFSDISKIDAPVDLVAIAISNKFVFPTLEACREKKVPSAIIISAGYAETGEEGKIEQERIGKFAEIHNMKILGPNCLGVVNLLEGIVASSSQSIGKLIPGKIALLSQSGALAIASICPRAIDRQIGFSYLISTGNEADLEISDFVKYLSEDAFTEIIAIFLEGVKNGKKFIEALDCASERSKPVVILKIGRTEQGRRSAITHTGNMTGKDDIYQAIFKQKGVIRVDDLDDLFEVSSLLSKLGRKGVKHLGVVTTSGGLGGLIADKCGEFGITLPEISEPTQSRLIATKRDFGGLSNPLDIRAGGTRHLLNILPPLLEDRQYDAVLVALALPAIGENSVRISNDLIELSKGSTTPIVTIWAGSTSSFTADNAKQGFRILEQSIIPLFYSPDRCVRTIASLNQYIDFETHTKGKEKRKPVSPPSPFKKEALPLIEGKKGTLTQREALELLRIYQIPVAHGKLINNENDLESVVNELRFPLVAKIESPQISHKTEANAVRLNVTSLKDLKMAYEEIIRNAKQYQPSAHISGVLIQEQFPVGTEIIIGAGSDNQFGPYIIYGLGGIFAEVYCDTSLRLPPIDEETALQMIEETRSFPIIRGWRGQPPRDVVSICQVLTRLSMLMTDLSDHIEELDINPLIVLEQGKGSKVADCLIKLRT